MKIQDARLSLRTLREAVVGMVSMINHGDTPDEQCDFMFIQNVMMALTNLDFFLTGHLQMRQEGDAQHALKLRMKKTVRVLLSDETTHLIMQWPTREDPRVIYPDPEGDAEILKRWYALDTETAQSMHFPLSGARL